MSSSPFMSGLLGRCPRCGKGKIINGLTITEHCPHCRLSLKTQDSGDGPVFFVLVIVGFLAVGFAAYVEMRYAPPLWVHAVIWIPFTIIACIAFMRFFKVFLIALQFKHNPDTL